MLYVSPILKCWFHGYFWHPTVLRIVSVLWQRGSVLLQGTIMQQGDSSLHLECVLGGYRGSLFDQPISWSKKIKLLWAALVGVYIYLTWTDPLRIKLGPFWHERSDRVCFSVGLNQTLHSAFGIPDVYKIVSVHTHLPLGPIWQKKMEGGLFPSGWLDPIRGQLVVNRLLVCLHLAAHRAVSVSTLHTRGRN